jgi:hypothetical protein
LSIGIRTDKLNGVALRQGSQAAMRGPFLALLILTAWDQARRDRRPLPEPPAGRPIVTVHVRIDGKPRQITVAMPAPPPPADEDDAPRRPRANMPIDIDSMVVQRENFDRWLFADGRSEGERRKYLEEILRSKVEVAAVLHDLTAAQRAKLRLAGRGDIKRFFDRVDDRRSAFESERRTFKTGYPALQRLVELSQLYEEGPFGDGSLYLKTLQKIDADRKAGR